MSQELMNLVEKTSLKTEVPKFEIGDTVDLAYVDQSRDSLDANKSVYDEISEGYEVLKDATGNVVIQVPATPGHEKAPTVIIQGHLDMVCEKNSDVDFDFMKDPIDVRVDGDWVKANGTTLGADNGIGVAGGA